MTDHRKLQRQGAALLVRLCDDPRYLLTEGDRLLINQLRAIPKPGNPNLPKTGGKRPGAGRKKKITDTAK